MSNKLKKQLHQSMCNRLQKFSSPVKFASTTVHHDATKLMEQVGKLKIHLPMPRDVGEDQPARFGAYRDMNKSPIIK
jgi:hypothetical protein